MPPPVDPRVREEAVRLVREGLSQSAVARSLGVAQTTLSTWCRLEGIYIGRPGYPDPPRARSRLYVGWAGGQMLPRPDLPEGVILRPAELQMALVAWRARVQTARAEEMIHRHVGTSWEADVGRGVA